MAAGLQLGDGRADRPRGLDVELDPRLRRRHVSRPLRRPEGRLGGLREWPHREGLHAVEVVVREVARRGLLELDAETLAPERAGRIGLAGDRSESGDERDLHPASSFGSERSTQNSLPSTLAMTTHGTSPWPMSAWWAPID